jgi:hypothetical protein
MFPFVKGTDANVMALGTVMPAPADTGLNLDNRG